MSQSEASVSDTNCAFLTGNNNTCALGLHNIIFKLSNACWHASVHSNSIPRFVKSCNSVAILAKSKMKRLQYEALL